MSVPLHPYLIVKAADASDVVATVRFAAEHRIQVAVRATGHCPFPGDLTDLAGAHRDLDTVEARAATVGPGVRWAQVLEAAAPHSLSSMCVAAPHAGVVGYLPGGGLSPVSRAHGLARDHKRSFEVVTGEGQLKHATPTENVDLS